MPLKTIHIMVKEDGSIMTDYQNFIGTDCLEAGKQMHALLAPFGVQVDQMLITPKPELLAEGLQQAVTAPVETNQELAAEG